MKRDPKSWEQLENETTTAYEAFCQYLDLEKRGGEDGRSEPRRYLQDLAEIRNCKLPLLSNWSRAWNWEKRAADYDEYMSFRPQEISELAARREYTTQLREDGQRFRNIASRVIEAFSADEEKLKSLKPEDAIRLYKLGMELEKKAQDLEQPATREAEEELNAQIRELFGRVTGGLGKLAAGSTPGVVTATERSISFDLAGGSGEQPVRAVSDVSGTVCNRDSGAELDIPAD